MIIGSLSPSLQGLDPGEVMPEVGVIYAIDHIASSLCLEGSSW